jgi:hypothetical protein
MHLQPQRQCSLSFDNISIFDLEPNVVVMVASIQRNEVDVEDVKKYSTFSDSADNEPTGITASKERVESPVTQEDSSEPLEQWNKPRINLYRYFATLYSFIVMGMNDSAYGVRLTLIP